MSTDQFLQAFRRHTALYGIPSLILCDNAATFTKADDEITKLFNCLDEPVVQHFANNKVIYMKHIPAKSPHWGGMYERLIGVVKMVIKKVLRIALIDLNEMQTLVKEVQSVVNDRPLTYISTSAEDPEPITPSKLLYGYDITTLPHPDIDPDNLHDDDDQHNGLNRAMKHRATVFQHFVSRFKTEYLSSLRERHTHQLKKAESLIECIKICDVVLVHDKDRPRCLWKLALVKDLIRGFDGFVRAAKVQMKNGVTSRSIHLLYPLEVSLSEPKEFFRDTNDSIPQETVTLRRSKRIASRPRTKFVESPDCQSLSD